jgi:hypothetical protein
VDAILSFMSLSRVGASSDSAQYHKRRRKNTLRYLLSRSKAA